MKFLLVATAALALIAAAAAQNFPDELRQFNEDFNEFHRDVDYFLRLRRINTSDMIEEQNRIALTSIWDSVLRLKMLTEVANDKLITVALEVGNQDPCIVALFEELQRVESRAGNEISACANSMFRQQENAMNSGFFETVDAAQRNSHFLQIQTLYTLGQHNAVTDQDLVRSDLNNVWAERADIRNEDEINNGHELILVSLQTARINLNNCMAVIEGMYTQDSDRIVDAAGACRRR